MGIKKQLLARLGVFDDGETIEEVLKQQGIDGKITQRTLLDLLVIICNYLENNEQQPSQKTTL